MANVLGEALDRREKLLAALKQLQPVRAQDLADWLGLPEASASAVLKELAQVGVAVRDGSLWSVRPVAPRAPAVIAAEAPEEGPRRRLVRPPEAAPPVEVAVPRVEVLARSVEVAVPPEVAAPPVKVAALPVEVAAPAPTAASRPTRREIIEANRHLLGTMSDPRLAVQLGVPREALTHARLEGGIPSFRSTGGMRRGGETEVPAPKERVSRVSAQATPVVEGGQERGDVRQKLLAHRDLLGTRADQSVAEELGVSRASVVQMRAKLGIPSWSPRGPGRPGPAPKPAPAVAGRPAIRYAPRPEPHAEPAAELPEPEQEPERSREPEPEPAPAAAAIQGFVWTATARDGEDVHTLQIAAADLHGAARAAMGALSGRVESIVMCGPMLIVR